MQEPQSGCSCKQGNELNIDSELYNHWLTALVRYLKSKRADYVEFGGPTVESVNTHQARLTMSRAADAFIYDVWTRAEIAAGVSVEELQK